jgi:3-oxoacyl-(acyl-carrier-protein) synthase
MRRVVVTGLGLVTPLGGDVETSWANILASKSGAGPITKFDATEYKCRIACEVKPKDHEYGFDPDKRVDHKVQRQGDRGELALLSHENLLLRVVYIVIQIDTDRTPARRRRTVVGAAFFTKGRSSRWTISAAR